MNKVNVTPRIGAPVIVEDYIFLAVNLQTTFIYNNVGDLLAIANNHNMIIHVKKDWDRPELIKLESVTSKFESGMWDFKGYSICFDLGMTQLKMSVKSDYEYLNSQD